MPTDAGAIDPELFEATVDAAWETWKRGSPQGNYFDMLATIDAALSVAKPMIERRLIEALAAEADANTPTYEDVTGGTVQFKLADWLRAHLGGTEATG